MKYFLVELKEDRWARSEPAIDYEKTRLIRACRFTKNLFLAEGLTILVQEDLENTNELTLLSSGTANNWDSHTDDKRSINIIDLPHAKFNEISKEEATMILFEAE